MENAKVAAEVGKPTNFIQKLQAENEELKKQLKDKEGRKFQPEIDDREEEVEVTFGRGSLQQSNVNCFYKVKMKKSEALDKLVAYYLNNRVKSIPKEDFAALPINRATCYLKMIKRILIGPEVGKKVTIYKAVPLWIAAERIVNHPNYQVELISKEEYNEWNDKFNEKERELDRPINVGKIKKAVETLANLA